ncbi:uncharacterized protein BDR25DRAFT_341219 [Lindgomyces ingoldianus]|uniref:Uncharacterized protein n=1 Tax=Lindgomyces ingoldianus TaxID=673940 RepID=A0ACB6R4L3_9PLEO|nr:uncharacterized protein BDR25DRAFT_341219 [Lindgomyces ingoldianus]KAF2474015.1 hypothetical protein BDR25DRAFT_341219 [Lindgomyces ingoldianus]
MPVLQGRMLGWPLFQVRQPLHMGSQKYLFLLGELAGPSWRPLAVKLPTGCCAQMHAAFSLHKAARRSGFALLTSTSPCAVAPQAQQGRAPPADAREDRWLFVHGGKPPEAALTRPVVKSCRSCQWLIVRLLEDHPGPSFSIWAQLPLINACANHAWKPTGPSTEANCCENCSISPSLSQSTLAPGGLVLLTRPENAAYPINGAGGRRQPHGIGLQLAADTILKQRDVESHVCPAAANGER